jgi:serine O-acetyltransferase
MPLSKIIISLFNLPRLLLHFFSFYKHYDVCKEDVRVGMELRHWTCSPFKGGIYLMVFDKNFRNLFYYRIGNAKYLMWYWLKPHPCFTLAMDMKVAPGFQCVHPFATIVNAEPIGRNFSVKY